MTIDASMLENLMDAGCDEGMIDGIVRSQQIMGRVAQR